MRRLSRLRRLVVGTAVVVVVVLVATTTFAWVTSRRPLPETTGEIVVDGLSSDVKVFRDAQGVPQIYASTTEDLFRAQGYVQAQDRFFEMDYRRHATAGRLAELVGNNETAIQADKVTRTLGWRKVAEEEMNLISQETRDYLAAYAEGVNAYLDDRDPGEIAVEYTVLGAMVQIDDPEPWEPVDSLAWLKAMAWDLRGNYNDELDRALAYDVFEDEDRVNALFPAYATAQNQPIIDPAELEPVAAPVVDATQTSSGTTAEAAPGPAGDVPFRNSELEGALDAAREALDAVPVQIARGEGTGSNSWVISGELTQSGKPLLANDPHLALEAPGVWAQVGLHCTTVGPECPFDVAGFSFAGFPGVVIGHNADLAWGLTNMGADVTDFFIERVRDNTWLRDSGADVWEPITTHTETIRVAGGSPVELEIRSTTHGPLISGVMDLEPVEHSPTETGTDLGEYEIALAWTALEPGRTADAVFLMNLAATPEDLQAAAAIFDVPAQNIVFATTDGHIGYQAPGRIPVRAQFAGGTPEPDGTWPRPGWDPRYDWTGYVDAAQMPRVLDPAEGFIVAANQAVLPSGTGPFLARDWDYGYRSERIRTLIQEQITAGRKFSVEDMSRIQNDEWSKFADVLVPVLLDVDLGDGYDADGQALLEDWDRTMEPDSAAAAYFSAVWRNLLRATFWDELPETMRPDGGGQWLTVLQTMLEDPENTFWDDRSTVAATEQRDQILTEAMVSARRDLTVELGKDAEEWTWGTLHQLRLEHLLLGGEAVPAPVRQYMNPAPEKVGGGSAVVNATSWDAGEATGSFDVTSGPSMRMVVDLDDLDASTWVVVTGTSAHPASSHYDDQLPAWAAGETFEWPFTAAAVEDLADDELTLVP
ncbi:penicillin acylase family protein [Antribacter gilvus]|uniref:penicillin acylase family protein n=1 Tax=Antribacter gilvus TaxID=2304675 RepID=UPI0013E0B3B9|nr:penicillin acylase family protein [Antribacter gilvus]